MNAETVSLETTDGPIDVYDSTPEGPSRGGVVIVQEAWGVDEHIRDVCDRLAAAGYNAVAPNLFHRSMSEPVAYGDMTPVLGAFEAMTPATTLADVDAAVSYLGTKGFPPAAVAVIGFCFGGAVAFLTASERALGAAVTFYGGPIVNPNPVPVPPLLHNASRLQTPWLGLYGEEDASIPLAEIELLEQAVASAAVATELIRFPGTGHAFHNDARTDLFNADAAAKAWNLAVGWLGQHLQVDD